MYNKRYNDIFAQIVKLSDPAKLIYRPYYIHPANVSHTGSIWNNKRLVLVDDAAHGMPPFAAQGVNQGLEDAAVIGTAIANIINCNALNDCSMIQRQFDKYEQLRRPLIAKVQEATLYNHNWSQEKWENYSDEIYCNSLLKNISYNLTLN